MGFNSNDALDEIDIPVNKLKKQAGAQVLQDIGLNTYWANTCGKTKYPGVYQLHKKELMDNLSQLLGTRMPYRELEDFMVVLGYETGDIRTAFKELTGMDIEKLEYMRLEDTKATPNNIPGFNLGWGLSKKKGVESYFIMPNHYGLFTIFAQASDTDRQELDTFLRHDEALEHLGGLVKSVHRYDVDAIDMIEQAEELKFDEPTTPTYIAVANRFYDLERKGELTNDYIYRTVKDTVTCGNLTEVEGQCLINKYAAPIPTAPAMETTTVTPAHTEDTPSKDDATDMMRNVQDNINVNKEIKKRTPQDFFNATLPSRIDEVATEHIGDVLSYVANRESDLESFSVALHSLQYQKHDNQISLGDINPQTGEPAGPPMATISAILEVTDNTMATDKNKKFILAVFFVNSNGQVSTSDSVKGEDDIIYGLTEDGLQQYFSKNKKAGV